MGLTLRFAIGDKDEIVDAIAFEDFETLEALEVNHQIADFSFHIVPDDLNDLFRRLGEESNSKVVQLREYLDFKDCFFDEADRGAYYVSEVIKNELYTLDESKAESIAGKWIQDLNRKYEDNIQLEGYHVIAVTDLINLIQAAKNEDRDLIHFWIG